MNEETIRKEAEKILLNFTKDELLSTKKEILEFFVEVAEFRPSFLKSFKRKDISSLEKKHIGLVKKFSSLLRKYETLDILFEDLDIPKDDIQKNAIPVMVYQKFTSAINQHVGESLRLVELIDDILFKRRNVIDFRISIFVAILAAAVAIISIIIQKF